MFVASNPLFILIYPALGIHRRPQRGFFSERPSEAPVGWDLWDVVGQTPVARLGGDIPLGGDGKNAPKMGVELLNHSLKMFFSGKNQRNHGNQWSRSRVGLMMIPLWRVYREYIHSYVDGLDNTLTSLL